MADQLPPGILAPNVFGKKQSVNVQQPQGAAVSVTRRIAEEVAADVTKNIESLPVFLPESVMTIPYGPDLKDHSVCKITSVEQKGRGTVSDPKMGPTVSGEVCQTCSQTINRCPGHLGRISFPEGEYFAHPLYIETIVRILSVVCNRCSFLIPTMTPSIQSTTGFNRLKTLADKVGTQECPRRRDDTVIGTVHANAAPCGKNPVYTKSTAKATYLQSGTFPFTRKTGKETQTSQLKVNEAFLIIDGISDEDVKLMGLNFHPRLLFFNDFPVMPPMGRPQLLRKGEWCQDKITPLYQTMVRSMLILTQECGGNPNSETANDARKQVRKIIKKIIEGGGTENEQKFAARSVKSILEGKSGMVRKAGLSGRSNYTGRTVLSGGSFLNFGEIGIPGKIASILTRNIVANVHNIKQLQEKLRSGKVNYIVRTNSEGQKITYSIKERPDLMQTMDVEIGDEVRRHLQDGDLIVFNRQPTLWKGSMMAYRARVVEGISTIMLHLASTTPHNADFDGDEGALHVVQEDMAYAELDELMAVEKNMMGSSGSPSTAVVYDSLSGSYLISDPKVEFTADTFLRYVSTLFFIPTVDPKRKPVDLQDHFERCDRYLVPRYSGRSVFSLLLPPEFTYSSGDVYIRDGILIKGRITKKQVGHSHNSIVQVLHNVYSQKRAQQFITEIYHLMTKYLQDRGLTVGPKDCFPADRAHEEKVKAAYDKAKQEIESLDLTSPVPAIQRRAEMAAIAALSKVSESSVEMVEGVDESNNLSIMMTSGAKGKKFNVMQITGCVGQVFIDDKRLLSTEEGGSRNLCYFAPGDMDPDAAGFVDRSFNAGLTPSQLIEHQASSRIGLVDTAVKTQDTGTMNRLLHKALDNLTVGYSGAVVDEKLRIMSMSYGRDGLNPERLMMVNVDGNQVSTFFDAKALVREINSQYGYMPENGAIATDAETKRQERLISEQPPKEKSAPVPPKDFPFRSKFMPPFKEMFGRVKEAIQNPPKQWFEHPRVEGERILVRRTFPIDYEQTDSLTDHFCEPLRILCKEKGHRSPADAWRNIRKSQTSTDQRVLREAVYQKERGCNLFNPVYAGVLYGNARSVLDVASGWGDRLVSCFASQSVERYVGWDTNPELLPIYQRIADECLAAGGRDVKWSVRTEPFERAGALVGIGGELENSFDVVIASPPFFDQEEYIGKETSTSVYKTEDEWFKKYYRKMLEFSVNVLTSGGHLSLYIPTGGRFLKEAQDVMRPLRVAFEGSNDFVVDVQGKIGRQRKAYTWRKF